MTITTNTKQARTMWGRAPLPQGAIVCGLAGDTTEALLWLPTGWWLGLANVLRRADARAAQSAWLKAVRDDRDWSELCAMCGVSQRTWEGWEQGRAMPALAVYQVAEFIAR